jgi:thioredoxin 1
MSSVNVFDFTTDNFQAKVLEANRPVLVFAWATWNPACRAMQDDVEKLADKYVDKLKVGRLDIERNEPIARTYGVQSLPHFLLFKGGVAVTQSVGAMTYSALENLVKPYI